jgi:hypothetical protein
MEATDMLRDHPLVTFFDDYVFARSEHGPEVIERYVDSVNAFYDAELLSCSTRHGWWQIECSCGWVLHCVSVPYSNRRMLEQMVQHCETHR